MKANKKIKLITAIVAVSLWSVDPTIEEKKYNELELYVKITGEFSATSQYICSDKINDYLRQEIMDWMRATQQSKTILSQDEFIKITKCLLLELDVSCMAVSTTTERILDNVGSDSEYYKEPSRKSECDKMSAELKAADNCLLILLIEDIKFLVMILKQSYQILS